LRSRTIAGNIENTKTRIYTNADNSQKKDTAGEGRQNGSRVFSHRRTDQGVEDNNKGGERKTQ